MSRDEWLDLTEKHDPVCGPWKWGHTETIELEDGRTVTAYYHCQEGIQDIVVDEAKA